MVMTIPEPQLQPEPIERPVESSPVYEDRPVAQTPSSPEPPVDRSRPNLLDPPLPDRSISGIFDKGEEASLDDLSSAEAIGTQAANPYLATRIEPLRRSLVQEAGWAIQTAKAQMWGPAVGLLVCSLIALFFSAAVFLQIIGGFEGRHQVNLIGMSFGIMYVSLIAITSLIIFLGSISMLQLKRYRLALMGCILAMIPVVSILPFCIFTYLFSIWGVILLIKPDVREAFHLKASQRHSFFEE